ncbi:hypothetical protein L2E82_23150 [Cichorium intybus]|uniref:Uncharacterized protein n=1 Tax=Cichorium intybus TaxID=13427 RepID=A0ACB9DZX4_CICIN|nr:hypothetical protein L2E82_23150 [Cichorium intybus]
MEQLIPPYLFTFVIGEFTYWEVGPRTKVFTEAVPIVLDAATKIVFLTPTVIKGDASGAQVVAHELAHRWTGNSITRKTGDHFWLNEGFTTYVERRIIEVVQDEDGDRETRPRQNACVVNPESQNVPESQFLCKDKSEDEEECIPETQVLKRRPSERIVKMKLKKKVEDKFGIGMSVDHALEIE